MRSPTSLRPNSPSARAEAAPAAEAEQASLLRDSSCPRGDDAPGLHGRGSASRRRRATLVLVPSAAALLWFCLHAVVRAPTAGRWYARGRQVAGLAADGPQGEWAGGYTFMQLADPQLGMQHRDKSWAEELALLRLALRHANRLRPRFVFISGDLTNSAIIDGQVHLAVAIPKDNSMRRQQQLCDRRYAISSAL